MKNSGMMLLLLMFFTIACNQPKERTFELIWETEAVFKVPESVLYDEAQNLLYVSNIDGDPSAKDSTGSIGKLAPDGSVLEVEWVKGLHAPKGMARYQNLLWVSDVDRMVAIDVNTGEFIAIVEVEGAAFLNDVAVDDEGGVYVSDSRTKKVYFIKDRIATEYLSALEGPNGLLYHNSKLYLLDAGSLYDVQEDKTLHQLASGMESSTDGIEPVNDNEFIVSCWNGVVYYVNKEGIPTVLLDTRASETKSADIGYDRKNQIVYIPTFFKNTVAAYQLK
jgi:DNA-binding beta-propeller fold protein YncE